MKGLIITLSGNYNYGNRLQNYALQEILRKYGIETETYNNIYSSEETINIKKKAASNDFNRILNGIKGRIKHKKNTKINTTRTENIKKFTDKYIVISKKQKSELNEYYDYFVLGSDQVWNPDFTNDFDLNLGLIGKGKTVISYAASFGVNTINDKFLELYKNAFQNIKNISVREKKGQELVKQISNKESQIVLDPTMLLTEADWRKIERRPLCFSNEKYVLVYCVSNTAKIINKYVSEIFKNNNIRIINLTDQESKEYTSGVEEFLYYIDNAEMIITDSFHACVFSILFKKDFYIMERKKSQNGMNSRIDTLLETFKLENRKIVKNKIEEKCDYKQLDEILELERSKSLEFIENALSIM